MGGSNNGSYDDDDDKYDNDVIVIGVRTYLCRVWEVTTTSKQG